MNRAQYSIWPLIKNMTKDIRCKGTCNMCPYSMCLTVQYMYVSSMWKQYMSKFM